MLVVTFEVQLIVNILCCFNLPLRLGFIHDGLRIIQCILLDCPQSQINFILLLKMQVNNHHAFDQIIWSILSSNRVISERRMDTNKLEILKLPFQVKKHVHYYCYSPFPVYIMRSKERLTDLSYKFIVKTLQQWLLVFRQY